MRWLGRTFRRLLIVLLLLSAVVLATLSSADPALYPPKGERVPVYVVDHGYHTGLILSLTDLRRAAVEIGRTDQTVAARLRWLASRFPEADWIELGWGDRAFYQRTRTVQDIQIGLAARALFVPTDAILQVVPGWNDPALGFPYSDSVALQLSIEGLSRLAHRLAETVPDPLPDHAIGPSLYGQGAFFPARLDYHLFRTCNHWVAWLLRGAGVPASAVPGTFSTTLMAELRWRAR